MSGKKKKGVQIYSNIISIRAQKGARSGYPGEFFEHKFGHGAEIIGNPDGTVTIRSKKGKRLWGRF